MARRRRLGWLADYLSRPVLVGYIHGVAVVLIVGQLGKLTGIDIDAGDPVPQLVEPGRNVGELSAASSCSPPPRPGCSSSRSPTRC
jgi:SulP family sulfate permease